MSNELIEDGKKRTKTILILVIVVAVLAMAVAWYISRSQEEYVRSPEAPKVDVMGKTDTAKEAFITKSSQQLDEQDKAINALQSELEKIKIQMDRPPVPYHRPAPPTAPSPGNFKIPPPPPPMPTGTANIPFAPGNGETPGTEQSPPKTKVLSNLIVVQTAAASEASKRGVQPTAASSNAQKSRETPHLPAGSFVKAVLLTGLDAPTGTKGQSSPYPVLLRVVDLAQLPNRFRGDIKECFILGESFGELSSERAHMRLNNLSCVRKDGAILEGGITAYAVGEDGKTGLSGRVVSKQGAILARSLIAGFLQGVANAFGQSATIVNIDPSGTTSTIDPSETTKAALGLGTSKAADQLAQFYISMAKEMFPVIEINSGRQCEVVFINKVTMSEVSR
jgi:conjugal transfer pilus assembly protein TraB